MDGGQPLASGLRARLTRRPALFAALLYAVLAVVVAGSGLLPGRTLSGADVLWSKTPWGAVRPPEIREGGTNFELGDAGTQFQPFLRYTRSRLPDVPLWNPYVMSGRPFLANSQSAVFSPFSAPAYVLPFWRSLPLIAVLKLFVAAFGTYLLARALGMRFGGALLAGLVFGFGMAVVFRLPWPHSNVIPLIPWLLLMTEYVVRRPEALTAVGLAAVTALQLLGGHPESSFHAVAATVVWFVIRVVQTRGVGRALIGPTAVFGAALAVGAGLAALALLPFLDFLSQTDLTAHRSLTPKDFTPPKYLLTLFAPDYWGRSTDPTVDDLLAAIQSERPFYAGALTLILAAAALILRPSRLCLAVAVLGALCLVIVTGLDPIFAVVTSLPGFDDARNSRMIILVLLCLALLAGWGLDALSESIPPPSRRRVLLAVSASLLALPVLWVVLRGELSLSPLGKSLLVAARLDEAGDARITADSEAARTLHLAALLSWLVFGGAAVALVTMRARAAIAAMTFVALAIALMTIDLLRAGVGFNPAVPVSHADQPATGAVTYLQSRRPMRFVGVTVGIENPLPPNVAMNYGLYDARGYDYPVERRYDALWAENLQSTLGDSLPTGVPPTPRALRTLSLLSVADLVVPPGSPPLELPGLRLAYEGEDANVYKNDGALPRVFTVDRQRVVPDGESARAAITAPGFDGLRVAVTERRIPRLPEDEAQRPGGPGAARLIDYGSEHVVAEATVSRPSLLVLTDTYLSGWKASVDGRSVPIHRVDYVLRGVELPAGTHRIELSYGPSSWRIGWIISAVSLILLAAGAFVAWRARGRTRRAVSGRAAP